MSHHNEHWSSFLDSWMTCFAVVPSFVIHFGLAHLVSSGCFPQEGFFSNFQTLCGSGSTGPRGFDEDDDAPLNCELLLGGKRCSPSCPRAKHVLLTVRQIAHHCSRVTFSLFRPALSISGDFDSFTTRVHLLCPRQHP